MGGVLRGKQGKETGKESPSQVQHLKKGGGLWIKKKDQENEDFKFKQSNVKQKPGGENGGTFLLKHRVRLPDKRRPSRRAPESGCLHRHVEVKLSEKVKKNVRKKSTHVPDESVWCESFKQRKARKEKKSLSRLPGHGQQSNETQGAAFRNSLQRVWKVPKGQRALKDQSSPSGRLSTFSGGEQEGQKARKQGPETLHGGKDANAKVSGR